MDELFGEGDLSPEDAALLRQTRVQQLMGGFGPSLGALGQPVAGLGPDEEHLLGSAYQGSIWATLALKALRELLIRKGLISEAEIVDCTNEVVRREWNEVVEQTAPATLASQYVVTDADGFPRLQPQGHGDAGAE